jgi:hypothetical protein
MENGELISKAQSVLNRRTINGRLHGDVGAALISEKGDVYAGVCVDTSGWGLCAERCDDHSWGVPHQDYRRCMAGRQRNRSPQQAACIVSMRILPSVYAGY